MMQIHNIIISVKSCSKFAKKKSSFTNYPGCRTSQWLENTQFYIYFTAFIFATQCSNYLIFMHICRMEKPFTWSIIWVHRNTVKSQRHKIINIQRLYIYLLWILLYHSSTINLEYWSRKQQNSWHLSHTYLLATAVSSQILCGCAIIIKVISSCILHSSASDRTRTHESSIIIP